MSDLPLVTATVTRFSPDFNQWAVARAKHYPRICVANMAPTTRPELPMVCEAILDGLGKDARLTTLKSPIVAVTHAWLSVGDIDEVWIVDAQQLTDTLLNEVISMLAMYGIGCRLLLSSEKASRTDARVAKRLKLVTGDVSSESELRKKYRDRAVTTPPSPMVRPRLPRVDGMMFRSTCRELLTPDHFAEVDAQFVALVKELRAEVRAIKGPNKRRSWARKLKSRLAVTPDADTFVLIVRAAQVAGVVVGFHVRVNTLLMLSAVHALPRPGLAEPGRWWELLDLYRDPAFGAVAALYTAGVSTADFPSIRAADVSSRDHDGAVTVTVKGDPVSVPSPMARFVTAQASYAHARGDDALLFSSHRSPQVRVGYANTLLVAPAADLGVEVAQAPVRSRLLEGTEWLGRYGISIEKLGHTPTAEAVG